MPTVKFVRRKKLAATAAASAAASDTSSQTVRPRVCQVGATTTTGARPKSTIDGREFQLHVYMEQKKVHLHVLFRVIDQSEKWICI